MVKVAECLLMEQKLVVQTNTLVGGSTPETLAVYSGFFFDDVVLLLDVSS